MIQRILITMALFMLFGIPAAFGQQSPEKVQQKVTAAMGTEASVQEKTDDWSWDKQEIIQEIRDAKYRVTWLQYRQEKNRQYIAKAQQNIEDLEAKKAELNKLREQLEPYLETVILRLEDFIAQDLPFLPSEREKRIAALKNSMDNYDLALSEKLRRVFEEGLQIEADYGDMIDVQEGETLNIGGIDTQVLILQLGRVGMYYMSMDEKQIGYYNTATGNWEALPDSMNREISVAMDIGQANRTVEIVKLPLGAVE
jgi:predicted RNase H-like nuclease (RuvC/YqgF family)